MLMLSSAVPWITLGALVWLGIAAAAVGLARMAGHADRAMEAAQHECAETSRDRPITSASTLVSEACETFAAGRVMLLAGHDGNDGLRVVARQGTAGHMPAEHVVKGALGGEVVVTYAWSPTMPAGRWTVATLAVPIPGPAAKPIGVLYVEDVAIGPALGDRDRRRLAQLAAAATPFMTARFGRNPSPGRTTGVPPSRRP